MDYINIDNPFVAPKEKYTDLYKRLRLKMILTRKIFFKD